LYELYIELIKLQKEIISSDLKLLVILDCFNYSSSKEIGIPISSISLLSLLNRSYIEYLKVIYIDERKTRTININGIIDTKLGLSVCDSAGW